MKRTYKAPVTEFDAIAVTVTIEGNTQEYAMALLHIVNNIRESKLLYKFDNYYWNNDITVYAKKGTEEELKEYLENFGTIKRVEKVLMLSLCEYDFDYDCDKYNDFQIVPYFEY